MTDLPEALLTGLDNHELVGACLNHYAARFPDRPFQHDVETGRTISWGQARDFCERFAQWLEQKDVGADDRVVVLSENSIEALLLFVAIMRRGACVCPIDHEAIGAQASELIGRLKPRIVLWSRTLTLGDKADGLPGEWMPFGEFNAGDDGGLFGIVNALDDGPPAADLGRPDSESVICFTSGTASAPKGVIHFYDNYALIGKSAVALWQIVEGDRFLEYRSFAWQSTHTLSLFPALLAGGSVGLARKFSRSRFFGWIRDWQPTVVIGIPAVVNMFVANPEDIDPETTASIRFMSCSTAPLHAEQLQKFEERYGIRIVQHYGMSEGGMLTGNPPDARRVGTVGPACLFQSVDIVDEDGNVLPAGETGEIRIQGPQICYGYLLEDGSVDVLRGPPLRTGDLGFLEEDGYLRITGRTKDTINRGGVKIAPLEVDKALMDLNGVAEAATVGVPDPVYGEEVVSYVVLTDGDAISEESIRAHCAATLADYKRPRSVFFIDAIPKNHRGKIDRPALVERWKRDHTEMSG